MSTPPRPVPEMLKILGASATKKVLVVEGPNDIAVYTKWLAKLAHPDPFTPKVEVVDAGGRGEGGGRSVVLEALAWFRDHGGNSNRVFGLVDRDEWDGATIAQRTGQLPQLRVNLDRHALESYFCDLHEIGPALTAHNAAWAGNIPTIQGHVAQHLPAYVDHWALLTTTDRLRNGLVEQGYPGHFANTIPIPPDAEIQQRFQQWAGIIDAAVAFAEFDKLRTVARAANVNVQCRSHIWAKRFFERVLVPLPNGLQSLEQKSTLDWMVDLAEWMPNVPGDIAAVLRPLLL